MNRLVVTDNKSPGLASPTLYIARAMVAGQTIEGRGSYYDEAVEELVERLCELVEDRSL